MDENQHLLSSRDRKQKRAVFQAVRNGSFSTSPAPKSTSAIHSKHTLLTHLPSTQNAIMWLNFPLSYESNGKRTAPGKPRTRQNALLLALQLRQTPSLPTKAGRKASRPWYAPPDLNPRLRTQTRTVLLPHGFSTPTRSCGRSARL